MSWVLAVNRAFCSMISQLRCLLGSLLGTSPPMSPMAETTGLASSSARLQLLGDCVMNDMEPPVTTGRLLLDSGFLLDTDVWVLFIVDLLRRVVGYFR